MDGINLEIFLSKNDQLRDWLRERGVQKYTDQSQFLAQWKAASGVSSVSVAMNSPEPRCLVKLLDEYINQGEHSYAQKNKVSERKVRPLSQEKDLSELKELIVDLDDFKSKVDSNLKGIKQFCDVVLAISNGDVTEFEQKRHDVFGSDCQIDEKLIVARLDEIFPVLCTCVADLVNIELIRPRAIPEILSFEDEVNCLKQKLDFLVELLESSIEEAELVREKAEVMKESFKKEKSDFSMHRPNQLFNNMLKHFKQLSEELDWGVSQEQMEAYEKGLCYGLSAQYLSAVVSDKYSDSDELAFFHKRLSCLGAEPGAKFELMGGEYDSLADAYIQAKRVYAYYEGQCLLVGIKPSFDEHFRVLYPQAHFFMEIPAWYHSLILNHGLDTASILPGFWVGQNMSESSIWSASAKMKEHGNTPAAPYDMGSGLGIEAFSSDPVDYEKQMSADEVGLIFRGLYYESEMLKSMKKEYAIFQSEFSVFLLTKELIKEIIMGVPDSEYLFRTRKHAFVVSLHDGMVTIFNQNAEGYFVSGLVDDPMVLNKICGWILDSVTAGEYKTNPVVAICSAGSSGDSDVYRCVEGANKLKDIESGSGDIKLLFGRDDTSLVSDVFCLACTVGDKSKVQEFLETKDYKEEIHSLLSSIGSAALFDSVMHGNIEIAILIFNYINKLREQGHEFIVDNEPIMIVAALAKIDFQSAIRFVECFPLESVSKAVRFFDQQIIKQTREKGELVDGEGRTTRLLAVLKDIERRKMGM